MDKQEARAMHEEANQLYLQGDYRTALDRLDKLALEFPRRPEIMYPRAMCLAAVGRNEEAYDISRTLVDEYGYTRAADLKRKLEALNAPPPTGIDPIDEYKSFSSSDGFGSGILAAPPADMPDRTVKSGSSKRGLIIAVVVVIVLAGAAAAVFLLR